MFPQCQRFTLPCFAELPELLAAEKRPTCPNHQLLERDLAGVMSNNGY